MTSTQVGAAGWPADLQKLGGRDPGIGSRKVARVRTSLISSFPTKPDAFPSGVAVEGPYHFPETPA